jgi:predicted nucleic acid-binding protein
VIVVDASVTLAWCLADEHDETAESVLQRVASEGAAAPGHWPLEVANGLLAAERRGRLTSGEVQQALRLIGALDVEIIPVELSTAGTTVLESARDGALSVYDAAYLDLAAHRGVTLATIDQKLAKACAAAGVDVA